MALFTSKMLWVFLIFLLMIGGVSAVILRQQATVSLAGTVAQQPTCTAALRGAHYTALGGLGVADVESVCVKSALDAYAWKVVSLI